MKKQRTNRKRVRGRVVSKVATLRNGQPGEALFVFEMTLNGLAVRKRRSRRSRARVWTFTQLANGAAGAGQMVLL